MNLVFELHK